MRKKYKDYRCRDCGKEYSVYSLWICPDDKLRCGDCMLKREYKAYPLLEKKEGGRA